MTVHRSNFSRRPRGFTLLEVILAMAMVAMLSLSLYASLRIAYKAKESATSAVLPARNAQVALDLLREDLESAMPPVALLAQGGYSATTPGGFIGQHSSEVGPYDSLEFCAVGGGSAAVPVANPQMNQGTFNTDDPHTYGGMRKIQLTLELLPDSSLPVLVRRVTTNLLSTQITTPEEEILCRGVRNFQIRYFDGTDWYDTWDSTQQGNALPYCIEILLDLQQDPNSTDPNAPVTHLTRLLNLPCHRDADPQQDTTTTQQQ